MAAMQEIEAKTREYAKARAQLAEAVATLQEAIDALKRKHMQVIKTRVAVAAEARAELAAALEDSPQLFVRPRTVIFHGIKVGWQKGRGEIEIEDPQRTVALIRRHMPDQLDTLVKIVETPVKSALAQLPAAELKKIGVTVAETGDQVVIRPTDTEVDKIVDALLRDAEETVS